MSGTMNWPPPSVAATEQHSLPATASLAALDPSEFLNPGSVHQSLSPMNTPSNSKKDSEAEQSKRVDANQVRVECVILSCNPIVC